MRDITLEELLEAGCHFGHQVNRRNPKADEFIFEERSKVHIINLEKTREGLLSAAEYLKNLSQAKGNVVFVGTKRQAQQIVKDEAERAKKEGVDGIFYVTARWIGGTFTNFSEVSKNFKRLKEIKGFLDSGKRGDYTKRELVLFERELGKLLELYGGIQDLEKIPDAIFVVGTQLETTAVSEARNMDVEIVGVVDTNADPTVIDYPIPANDDAVGSIKLITSYLVDAWIEGAKEKPKTQEKEKEEKAEKTSEPKKAKTSKKKTEVATA